MKKIKTRKIVPITQEFICNYGLLILWLQGEEYLISSIANKLELHKSVIINYFNIVKIKTCIKCRQIKPNTLQYFNTHHITEDNITVLKNCCKLCFDQYKEEYYAQNRPQVLQDQKSYRKEHPEKVAACKKRWAQNNPEKIKAARAKYEANHPDKIEQSKKEYRQKRRAALGIKSRQKSSIIYIRDPLLDDKEWVNARKQQRRKLDPIFRLKESFSNLIRFAFRSRGLSKNRSSSWKSLPYTPIQLREHLISCLEWWMTEDNYGIYDHSTWIDADPTTWRWQIDHIIRQALFSFTHMDQSAFQLCFGLANLRPFSAKQNLIENQRPLSDCLEQYNKINHTQLVASDIINQGTQ